MAQVSTPILAFAPEPRALVFANAVVFPNTLVRTVDGDEGRSIRPQLSLLLTNKAVYEEAAALFYELNIFRFTLPAQCDTHSSDLEQRRREMETRCASALTVPTHHINRLRHVVFYKPLKGYWPDGPLKNSSLGPDGLGEKELALMLDTIATHSARPLDRGRRFSSIVERLPQLRRLEIWKGRRCYAIARYTARQGGGVEKADAYATAVEEAKLRQVREGHFGGVKSARYERRAWGKFVETQHVSDELFMAEGFVLNFTH